MEAMLMGDLGSLLRGVSMMEVKESKMEDLAKKVKTAFLYLGKTIPAEASSRKRLKEIYKVQQLLVHQVLPELIEKPKKSDEEAKNLRVMGNQKYVANDLMEARRLYTRAICCAEADGEEMAMSYANRSAVTFLLKEYENAIEDATRALSTGKYPEKMTRKLVDRRGKCFLALGQYSKAYEDFQNVIKLILDSESDATNVDLMKKYNDFLAECQGKKDKPIKSPVATPVLTHGPSPHIQCASSAVDIAYSPKMGRHILATVDIAPGDILAIERPYASILERHSWELFCHFCQKRCHSSIPCPSCNEVVFCSEKCRDICWISHHSLECQMLHNLINLDPRPSVLLAVQTLLKATKCGENLPMFIERENLMESESAESGKPEERGFVNGVYRSDHFQSIHNLTSNMKNSKVDHDCVAAFATSIVHILKTTTTFFDQTNIHPNAAGSKYLQKHHLAAAELLMRYICIMESGSCVLQRINEVRWKRMGDQLELSPQPIGGAVFPFLSLQNHSCDADTLRVVHDGNAHIMVAVKPISKGQQIFGIYTVAYQKMSKFVRQQVLRTDFSINCKCIACLEDWPTSSNVTADIIPKLLSTASKNRFRRELGKKVETLKSIILNRTKGKLTDKELKDLVQIFTMIHKNVKQPCSLYSMCQDAIFNNAIISYNPFVEAST